MNRRIVFLDFDGVINRLSPAGYYLIDEIVPVLVQRVGRMVNTLDASVVVSSDWRHWCKLDELRQILAKHGNIDPSRVLGTTESGQIRGVEIENWLKAFNQPVQLAVLDDNHLGRFSMDAVRPWFVQTNPRRGVSEANIAQASALLIAGPTWELTNAQLV